jgi:hypothetical protein
MATLFAISRRRMVVPIYKKWEATKVRIQILTLGNVTKIAAFFEDFSHADAMVFQIKAADTFEKAKGDKAAKYCVKFVDAKFSLPKKEKEHEGGDEEVQSDSQVWGKGVRRKYINLEGLEYAGEHDDITIGFETEEGKNDMTDFKMNEDADKSHSTRSILGRAAGSNDQQGVPVEKEDLRGMDVLHLLSA